MESLNNKIVCDSDIKVTPQNIKKFTKLPKIVFGRVVFENIDFTQISHQIEMPEIITYELILFGIKSDDFSFLKDVKAVSKINIINCKIKTLKGIENIKTSSILIDNCPYLETIKHHPIFVKSINQIFKSFAKKYDLKLGYVEEKRTISIINCKNLKNVDFRNDVYKSYHLIELIALNLKKIPEFLKSFKTPNLNISDNKIKKIENLPKDIEILTIANNQLEKLENIPFTMKRLNASNNKINSLKIENAPENLFIEALFLDENQIEVVDDVNYMTYRLSLNCNRIKKIKSFSKKVNSLSLDENFLTEIDLNLKDTQLEWLDARNNKIEKVKIITGKSMKRIDLMNNKIKEIEFSGIVDHLNLTDNRIETIKNLNGVIKMLDISLNPLKEFNPKAIIHNVSFSFFKEFSNLRETAFLPDFLKTEKGLKDLILAKNIKTMRFDVELLNKLIETNSMIISLKPELRKDLVVIPNEIINKLKNGEFE